MRALLWTDMEGMARVTDHRQCWPAFPQYWESGRREFTDEVIAAAQGLLDGGADQVHVYNGHGLGWPNVIWEDLPDGVFRADDDSLDSGFDAMFQTGFHARAGTADGFASHTLVPGLTVFADEVSLTEAHIWAWLYETPVLGIAGDQALAGQLEGFLDGTPFLPVKRSTSRTATTPTHVNRAESLAEIRDFAAACTRRAVVPIRFPQGFTLRVGLDPELARQAEGVRGLRAIRPGVLEKEAQVFSRDAYPAIQVAMGASVQPLLSAQADMNLDTEQSMREQDPEQLELVRRFFLDWMSQ